MTGSETFKARSNKIILGTLLIYATLVLSHKGEFWPFSIYPMFSQGGNPWVRAIVRDVTDADIDSLLWLPVTVENLAGSPYPLEAAGINTNDIANFVSKNKDWSSRRMRGLQSMFADDLRVSRLLIYKAEGRIVGGDVEVTLTPVVLLDQHSFELHPDLQATS